MVYLRRLSFTAVVLTVLTAFMGSYVRGRGAGLSCPDWPLCYGRLIPPMNQLVFLEWAHRLMVVLLSLIVVGVVVQCWRKRLPERWIGSAALALLLVQAVLGGLTVLIKLDPIVVASHQGMALIFFGTLVWLTLRLPSDRNQRKLQV
jgi:cytochrome c oxidase assembly protein subunit 15